MPTPEEKLKMMEDHTERALAAPRPPRPVDKTALSYWFPLIQAAGVPVPRTEIIKMPEEAQQNVWNAFDGKLDGNVESFTGFCRSIEAAASNMGYPFFLRTDHTSGKHSWDKTCFVRFAQDIPTHVFAIAEFSECCSLMGLPWDVWAVREYLPIMPVGACPGYGNMPVTREFRFFVDDGVIRCRHPYWPGHAIEQGGLYLKAIAYEDLCTPRTDEDTATIDRLAQLAGKAVGGSWSIDLLETGRGWFVTDMAEANKSFHWEGCPHQENPK